MPSQGKIYTLLGLTGRIFALIFLVRLVRDTGARTIFPFIPQLAEGLGLSVVAFSWLIFIQAMGGMVGPIFGVLSDRYGRRKIMVAGLCSQGIGALGLAASHQWGAALPMFMMGLGTAIFMPAQQAYIGDQVDYHKRGRAMATTEFSWALTAILILPVIGWLIDTFGWQMPFLVMGPVAFLGAILVWFGLSRVEHHTQTEFSWPAVRAVVFRPNVIGTIAATFFTFTGLSSFLSMWSIWLTHDFGLRAAQLGLVATAIGITELGGSVSSSLFIDRLGKKQGATLGLLLGGLVFLTLPLTKDQFPPAIAGLVTLGLLMEFTIVSLIPLYSEQVPHARGTVLSLMALGAALGLAIGPPVTATLWTRFHLWGICVVGAICLLAAGAIISKFLHED